MSSSYEKMLALWGEVSDVEGATAVLSWDQETYMPAKGATARGKILSTLAGVRHAKLNSPELRAAIDGALDEVEAGSVEQAQVLRAQKEVNEASCIPADLATAIAEAESNGLVAWQAARKESDFALFEAQLTELVELNREKAAAINPDMPAYDVMLNLYEEGVTEEQLVPIFDELGSELAPLIKAAADVEAVDESCAIGNFSADGQRDFAMLIARKMGYDTEAGRLDKTTHPFCTTFGADDVRITWRWLDDDFRSGLSGVMHEAGHGLYEQGRPSAWARTPLFHATGLGMHESQSRMWENMVGRSEGFWQWAMPHFREAFPEHAHCSVEQMVKAQNTSRPSLIRVEADEATYNLHVAARFEIERKLFSNQVEVKDLPEMWDNTYQDLLGIKADTVAEGVLQDIHWAMGAFGYFPTYSLGNIICAQLYKAAENELGDLQAAFSKGEFAPLLKWLRENIHQHGRRYSTFELLKMATGEELCAAPLLTHLKERVSSAYGLKATK
ncbi:MAG: carboxypeptidase M32 [Planctomycetes bacterium]|nr:carboxypeptidase M32 [Planctomycetota bacterium]